MDKILGLLAAAFLAIGAIGAPGEVATIEPATATPAAPGFVGLTDEGAATFDQGLIILIPDEAQVALCNEQSYVPGLGMAGNIVNGCNPYEIWGDVPADPCMGEGMYSKECFDPCRMYGGCCDYKVVRPDEGADTAAISIACPF